MPPIPAIFRLSKYSVIGFGTFLFDLALLYVFIDTLKINFLVATGIAFLVAVSINYFLSRRLVFKKTERAHRTGYPFFITIALTGMLVVVGLMYVSVELLGFPTLISRILVAGAVGMWNYLMNLYLNFKVAGVY